MPLWAWILAGLGALGLVFLIFVIWSYPKDGSF